MIAGLLPALIPVANAQQHELQFHYCTAADLTTHFPAPFCVFLHPGVNDTYRHGWSHTLGTLWGSDYPGYTGVPGTPDNNAQTREVFDKYLDYAILASASDSIGDVQFDFDIPITTPVTNVTNIDIFVPPEFTFTAPTKVESIWTDITQDQAYISVSTRSAYDPIAPGWTRVRIGQDNALGGRLVVSTGIWHVRLFHLKAPSTAGLYHFKIYARVVDGPPALIGYHSIGEYNYPITVIKGELNPAWVEVTVRTHAFDYIPGVLGYASGKVVADGTTPDGRSVQAWGFFSVHDFIGNSATAGAIGAMYRLYLFGLPEGTYTVTAEASGFNPTVTDRFTVLAGQSYHISIVVFNSPFIAVTLWSKHGTGAIPWHNLWERPYGTNDPAAAPSNVAFNDGSNLGFVTPAVRDVTLNLFDKDNNLIAWWASDTVHGATQAVPWAGGYASGANKELAPPNMLLGYHDDANVIPVYGTVGGTRPQSTSYYAALRDNCDPTWTWDTGVIGNPRGYSSTHWDGHVPYTWADYVAGWANGQYTVEAYITGYIMDEADAYQRTFVLAGLQINQQIDLRRTNWIETTVHMPVNAAFTGPLTTLVLTAEDANGNERGAASFFVTPAMVVKPAGNEVIDGMDASGGTYHGGIVIEGWNAIFPNFGPSGTARNAKYKDYGLNPTASTHSPDAPVELAGNPYTVKLYMADMGIPSRRVNGTGWYNIVGGPWQTTVALCNSPQPLSFSVTNASLWISLRSTDFEIPAHSRPWTFPGSEIWVDFINDQGTSQAILDPTIYGLIQDAGTWNATMGWYIPGTNRPAFDPGYGVSPFDIDYYDLPGQHEHVGVHYYGVDWSTPDAPMWGWYYLESAMDGDVRPTSLPAGQYTYQAYTHGYVQRRSFPVSVPASGWADIEADLIQGGQIRVMFDFYHENTGVAFNGYVRVEVFNDKDQLVGASIYGQAEPNLYTQAGTGGAYLGYNILANNRGLFAPNGPAQAADFGQPNVHEAGNTFPSSSIFANGQRAVVSSGFYSSKVARPIPGTITPGAFNTWAGWDGWRFIAWQTQNDRYNYRARSDSLTMHAGDYQAFDVYGFYLYWGDAARTWGGGYPVTNGFQMSGSWIDPTNGGNYWLGTDQWDYGMPGSVDIPGWAGSGGGLYHVKVWAFDPWGPNNLFEHSGFTDDWQMYSMGWPLENIQLPWGGAVSLWIDMNAMATLKGTVRWFDMFGNLRTLPWAQISATNPDTVAYASGLGAVADGTSDPSGSYIMWLPAGTHDVSVSTSEAPGIWSSSAPTSQASFTISVSDGWTSDVATQLSGSGTPVPEVPAYLVPLGLFAALAASAWLLRKRNLNVPILMK